MSADLERAEHFGRAWGLLEQVIEAVDAGPRWPTANGRVTVTLTQSHIDRIRVWLTAQEQCRGEVSS